MGRVRAGQCAGRIERDVVRQREVRDGRRRPRRRRLSAGRVRAEKW